MINIEPNIQVLSIKKYSLKTTKYPVSFRGPTFWKNILDKEDKNIDFHLPFKKKIKSTLLKINNKFSYF